MTTSSLHDALNAWEDQIGFKPAIKSSGRNILSGRVSRPLQSTSRPTGRAIYQKMLRTVQKTPEVLVKISGGGKNMRSIKMHFDYISRQGDLNLEDECGNLYHGKADLSDLHQQWSHSGISLSEVSDRRREAFNIVLSMQPGTNRQAVKDAARGFAKNQFAHHQYVFVAHDDEDHPHIHICVKAVDRYGCRLNPRKGDLQHWRAEFAQELRDQGIAANATPRRARGIVQKADKQVLLHIDQEFSQGKRQTSCFIRQSQREAAVQEAANNQHQDNPAEAHITARRHTIQKAYGYVAKALSRGSQEDQELALIIISFAQSMPPLIS